MDKIKSKYKNIGLLFKMLKIMHKTGSFETWCIIGLSILSGLLPIISVYSMVMISRIFIQGLDVSPLFFALCVFLAISPQLGYIIISSLEDLLQYRLGSKVMIHLNDEIKSKVQQIDFRYRESSEYQNIQTRAINSVSQDSLVNVLRSLPALLGTLVSIISLAIVLMAANVFVVLLFIVIFALTFNARQNATQKFFAIYFDQTPNQRKTNAYYGNFVNMNHMAELKIYNAVSWMKDKWKKQFAIMLKENGKNTFNLSTK